MPDSPEDEPSGCASTQADRASSSAAVARGVARSLGSMGLCAACQFKVVAHAAMLLCISWAPKGSEEEVGQAMADAISKGAKAMLKNPVYCEMARGVMAFDPKADGPADPMAQPPAGRA